MTDLRLEVSANGLALLPKTRWLAGTGLLLGGAALFIDPPLLRIAAFAAAATLVVLAAFVVAVAAPAGVARARRVRTALDLLAQGPDPAILSDGACAILWRNAAAADVRALEGPIARLAADPADEVRRLVERAREDGRAEARITAPDGYMRVSAVLVAPDRLLWRYDDLSDVRLPGLPDTVIRLTCDEEDVIVSAAPWRGGALSHLVGRAAIAVTNGVLEDGAATTLDLGETALDVVLALVPRSGRGRDLLAVPLRQVDRPASESFDRLPVPIMTIGQGGRVEEANRLARQLLRVEAFETPLLSELVQELGRSVGDWLADAFAGRSLQRPEVVRAARAEDEVFVQVTLDRLGDETGRLVAVLHDATELKSLQGQFIQSQKMQAIGQLAGGVAHDFNNLLTAISGHCDLLLLRHDPGDPDFADLDQINQNANRAAGLVGQLLAFSRKQNLQPELLDLRQSIADLTLLLNRLVGEPVRLSFRNDPDLELVRADKRQIEQVIMNLVVNARDAMPEGGEIEIETRMEQLDAPERRSQVLIPAGHYVVVEVRDGGTGIAPDKLDKIFEPFFTTKRTGEGTGLGLSTAYGIVKQSGGFIFVDSTPGQGSVFTVVLPAISRPAASIGAEGPEEEPAAPVTPASGVVLLVEDEAPVRAFAARALRLRGLTVLEAGDAEEALEILSDRDLAIDVFLTDVIMPGRDGPSWVREALARRPDTRVVFVSGYAEENFTDIQSLIPNSVFLPKPFSLTDLVRTVEAQIV